jgi:hypothetical protein
VVYEKFSINREISKHALNVSLSTRQAIIENYVRVARSPKGNSPKEDIPFCRNSCNFTAIFTQSTPQPYSETLQANSGYISKPHFQDEHPTTYS